jgi:hypothetical protein
MAELRSSRRLRKKVGGLFKLNRQGSAVARDLFPTKPGNIIRVLELRCGGVQDTCLEEMYILWARASHRVCASHGRVSSAGMHLKDLHLIGAYISQDVHLGWVYLIGVALSRGACIS